MSQRSTKEDDTSWLDLLESFPTATRLISAFLPAIRLAIQQETSTRVVRTLTSSTMVLEYFLECIKPVFWQGCQFLVVTLWLTGICYFIRTPRKLVTL